MASITQEYVKDKAAFKRLPILTLDERYYRLFLDNNDKPESIKVLEERLNALLKKQGQVTNDIKEVKKIKSKLIQNVVINMESDENDSKHMKRMHKSQKLIQEAKEKIAALEDEELELPRRIAEANQALMIATVNFCYEKMNTNKEDIAVLEQWIKATRTKLKKKLLIKQDKENYNNVTYGKLHDILGHDVMSLLDAKNEE